MNIEVKWNGIDTNTIEERRGQINKALDNIWQSEFVNDSISHNDSKLMEDITPIADKLAEKSDKVVIIATGHTAAMIRCVVSGVTAKAEAPNIIVFGDTLSAAEYTDLIAELETCQFSLLIENCGNENVELLAAYTTLKKLLIERYGSEGAMDRIYILCDEDSKSLIEDAAENDIGLLKCRTTLGKNIGNSEMVLLPLAIAGGDTAAYLNGFRQMISSPIWDLSGINYAALQANLILSKAPQFISIWQRQLLDIAKWIIISQCKVGRSETLRNMPMGTETDIQDIFDTVIFLDKEETDVMMPSFKGCDEDGSLNQLTKTTMENSHRIGVSIHLTDLNMETMGQLTAFVQLSNEITEYLCKN